LAEAKAKKKGIMTENKQKSRVHSENWVDCLGTQELLVTWRIHSYHLQVSFVLVFPEELVVESYIVFLTLLCFLLHSQKRWIYCT
jgi:hypothetical protein